VRNATALTDSPKLEGHEIHPLALAQAQQFIETVKNERLSFYLQ
jgi:hypothetical protein